MKRFSLILASFFACSLFVAAGAVAADNVLVMTDIKTDKIYSKLDKLNLEDVDRMEKLYDYVFRNFNRKITIKEVSEVMSISPNSFCKYFKSRTNKVFSDFVSEVRIGNACKLLIENNLSITQICYESGFNNISNFYRQFKHIKQLTPSEFQKKYLKTADFEPLYMQY